jgi:hypothetical protein
VKGEGNVDTSSGNVEFGCGAVEGDPWLEDGRNSFLVVVTLSIIVCVVRHDSNCGIDPIYEEKISPARPTAFNSIQSTKREDNTIDRHRPSSATKNAKCDGGSRIE